MHLVKFLMAALFVLGVAPLTAQTTFTVTSTADPGDGVCDAVCTLREAINAANASAATTDTIAFDITGAGPHTIAPGSALPTISDPLVIDGYTQSGASANTNPVGQVINATLMIVLDGSGAGGVSGLTITAAGCTVRGTDPKTHVGGELSPFTVVVCDGNTQHRTQRLGMSFAVKY